MPRRIEPFAAGSLVLLRRKAGMTQAQLGAVIGVSARQIASYEQGAHAPSPRRLRLMAQALRTSAHELAGVPAGEESLADLRRFAGLDRVDVVALLDAALPDELGRVTEWKLQAMENGRAVTAWLSQEALQEIIPALAKIYRVPVRTVRRSWFRSFPEQGYLLRAPRTADREQGQRRAGSRTWEELTRRQRAYLVACFREDQQAEKRAAGSRAAGHAPGRAAQWRRIPFTVRADPAFTGYTRIQERLRAEGWHDAGAGATLHALARRDLLRVSEDEVEVFPLGFVPRVVVEMTRAGRACVRAGLKERPAGHAPGDLLSQWLWTVLVKVAEAGEAGLAEDALWGRAKFYLGTGYRPGGALSRGFIDCLPDEGDGHQERVYRWVVTAAGWDHIRHHAADYRELYPGIAADTAVERVSEN
ncbi:MULTISPECIES: helix-turn-helix domain-containing protein [Streptomyces]|uniref:Helix-turn-helix transcriptional regulator n=1 Tax=Streptomyces edwardsiae TaxID=3075527 RepID=A0ABU2QPD8_9ACTN|nr:MULTISPECIES: helix-turn-helix transcriptional regulator [Streptomyces]MDT0405335.1 helix-turn-helix transcriptional regulator [Streptomyces sp. DSM 41635]